MVQFEPVRRRASLNAGRDESIRGPCARFAERSGPFAPVKPPFEAAFTDPAGDIWLEKSRAPADSSRRYHVTDRRGRLLREIRVPGPGRILAVGDRTALVAERVRDGTRFVLFRLTADEAGP